MEFDPPFPLSLPARRHWDRIAKDIHSQGRWNAISKDMLASFCQTLSIAQDCMNTILEDGVLVSGSRNGDKVRHPLLTPLSQSQAMLVKLARVIPLADPKSNRESAELDAFITEMVSW